MQLVSGERTVLGTVLSIGSALNLWYLMLTVDKWCPNLIELQDTKLTTRELDSW